jgi:hypothetical protein
MYKTLANENYPADTRSHRALNKDLRTPALFAGQHADQWSFPLPRVSGDGGANLNMRSMARKG